MGCYQSKKSCCIETCSNKCELWNDQCLTLCIKHKCSVPYCNKKKKYDAEYCLEHYCTTIGCNKMVYVSGYCTECFMKYKK